jgi:aminopeptidase N
VKIVTAYGPGHGAAMRREARLPEILRVLSRRWGPYPAPSAGGMFVADAIPYDLETYTRPVYSTSTNLLTIVHENGHQWWGDHISLDRWKDICFNECLASYSEWLWLEHNGTDLDKLYRDKVAAQGNALFAGPLYDMGAGHEFDAPVYTKGKFFVHALRNKVGDAAFFRAMRGIQRTYGGGNLSMLGWRDALEARTGVDLTSFWDEWVLSTGRPSDANLFPGSL